MFINIDKSMVIDKFDLLVYCYTIFRSLDEEKGYYSFSIDSLLEDMNIKINERNWIYIDKAIENLESMCKIFDNQYERDSYVIGTLGYEPDIVYFKLYKHEFDLLIDETKSLIENSKILHYYCWILSCLDLKTQTFPMSNSFIQKGYDITDKTVKKNNDKLIELGLVSVSTEYQDGSNTTNFYKRLYFEEIKLDEPADMDEYEEISENIEIKPTVYIKLDADEPIEKINSLLAKQGNFYLSLYDLIGNDYFEVDTNWTSIVELVPKYREKFNDETSVKALEELRKVN